MDPQRLAALRADYRSGGLTEQDVAPQPFTQFSGWLAEAVAAGLPEPNAMVFATADHRGRPSARTVLLKEFDERGFVLFTNYGSRKGVEATENPWGSLVFPWFAMGRQVVVVGAVERLSLPETERYFRSRPRGSQLGAWASEQSSVVAGRTELEERYAAVEARFPEGVDVPVPEHWGGLRVVPETVEFWVGRESRMHDRLRYRRAGEGWAVERLSP
jgi:pyridoxamine 5'-phosphate oxidase